VDPDGARRRRERAERDEARVRFWRDNGGTAALAAYGLPTDEALAAHANVNQRAGEYKKAGAFPDARMDQLRVLAYLDLLNGVSAAARIARARAAAADQGDNDPGNGRPAAALAVRAAAQAVVPPATGPVPAATAPATARTATAAAAAPTAMAAAARTAGGRVTRLAASPAGRRPRFRPART
jgi:hypothetical protein